MQQTTIPASPLHRVLEVEVMDTPEEAQTYALMDHRQANSAFVDRLVELGAHGNMLDLGTGPGDIPLLVVERMPGRAVLALDKSKEMLKIARKKRATSRHACHITFHYGDVKQLPFVDHSFHTVFSNTILHHLADPREMLREAARVMKPGSVLLIRDLYRPADEQQLDKLVQQYAPAHDELTAQQQKMFRDSLLAALTPEELRSMAAEVGLGDCRVVIDSDRHMSLQSAKIN